MQQPYKTKNLQLDSVGESKFSDDMKNLKHNMRQRRLKNGLSMDAFARSIGVSRKKLEDIEALRGYGCYVSWEIACKASDELGVSLDYLRGV